MKTMTLQADAIIGAGAPFHFTRAVLARNVPKSLHDHGFYEIFWLHNGRARHVINGAREMLSEGDLLFIRPGDCHALQGVGEESHLVSLSIRREVIEGLSRHAALASLFDPALKMPARRRREIRQMLDLSHRAVTLEMGRRGVLEIEAFLLALMAELEAETLPLPEGAPDWLVEACRAAHRPEVFRSGAAGLARTSGKAHAHVSRTVQKYLGQTPSDYVNRIRIDHAARRLAGTGDSLAEIAEEVGITNMSHFHRLFRAQFAMTPRAYRLAHQKGVVQP